MDLQSDQIDRLSELNHVRSFRFLDDPSVLCQLAALKLIEQGKITLDTPVGDYLPEFRSPIIVDKTSTQDTSFRPAETIVTLKHLLNFTSGLFYPMINPLGTDEGYSSKEMHHSDDPASEFFRVVTVRLFF